MNLTLLLFAVSLLCFATTRAAPPELDPAKDLPRFPAVEATNALGTFQIKQGFHLELVASEPRIQSPIALSFDENGRMFVVEMIDYSERRNETLGRIVMLEDTKGTGRFDKSTVYATNMAWPTGIICYGGGIFVAATPDILWFKDTDGDGKADVRKVIFSGFGNTKDRLNVQGLFNSFNWGLDNRIHGATAPNGGIVTNMVVPTERPLILDNNNFSFDPRTFLMSAENGGGQYGMSFDTKGRKYVCSNSRHIMTFMYDGKYAARNQLYAMPGSLVDIPVDGPAAEVYRISPEEPWRVIRTKWRVSGIATGPIEGGGRSAGYFTGATGTTIYRGSAFPPEYLDNSFTGDAGGNLVHRKLIVPEGVGVKAMRPPDERNVEFLASKDTWFRPVQFANAPDGTLYVIDMYREVIEHPWSLPEQIKKHIDLNSGNDRGRVYRIAPDGFKQPKPPTLGKYTTAQLVATLENSNGWHRDTAARLIYERQDKTSVAALAKLVDSSVFPLARMTALHVLDGLKSLNENHVICGLSDADSTVREHAVKLSERFLPNGIPSAALWSKLSQLTNEVSTNVLYQLTFTLGEVKNTERVGVLAQVFRRHFDNSWMQAAALSSLAEGAPEMFQLLTTQFSIVDTKPGQNFLAQLATLIGAKNRPQEVNQILGFIGQVEDPSLGFALVRALGEGLQRAKSSLAAASRDGSMAQIFTRAGEIATDDSADAAIRSEAIQLLALNDYAQSGPILLSLLNPNRPQELQLVSLKTLARMTAPQIADELIKRWEGFTPQVRSEAMTVLLARTERASALLAAIQSGKIARTDLTTAQIKFLRNNSNGSVRAKAATVLGPVIVSKRQEIVNAFLPGLKLTGDANHGKAIYLERCASCHRLGGEGYALGPDLVTVKNAGKEKMLVNILDPNLEVTPNFQAYVVEMNDGESVIGLIANETPTSVTVRQAFGKEDVILRSNVKKMQSQGQSLMPEGLEVGWKTEDAADLLEYISTAKAEK